MKQTIELSEADVKKAIAAYLKLDARKIGYCGWSGICNFGKFLVEVKE